MKKHQQACKNYKHFKKIEDNLIEKGMTGKVVVLRNESVVAEMDTENDAIRYGDDRFGIGEFSIQVVGDNKPADLGFQGIFIKPSKKKCPC